MHTKSVSALRAMLDSREVSAREVVEAHLARIDALNPTFNAFLHVAHEEALQQANVAQAMIDEGKSQALTGIPIALKDNINIQKQPTTCASRILEGYIPPFDAGVTLKLQQQGAVIVGKTNMDEFAMGASTETGAFGPCRNPWDQNRSVGGSSGGSAAAVAAGMVPVALGSDTGGSVRQPASLCGIVGFKPTYGRCSRYGLVAFSSSLDQIGPFGRTVEDAALLAHATTGHDPKDGTSIPDSQIAIADLRLGDLNGKRIAIPKETIGEGIDPDVLDLFKIAIDRLATAGAIVEEVSIPAIQYGVTTYYIIAPAEASSNLARFDGVRYGLRVDGTGHIGMTERSREAGFGHEVKSRIMIGTYALSAGYYDAFYLRAQQVRALMVQQINNVFAQFDFIASPTSPIPAFVLGELTEDPLALKKLDYCTIPANMGGYPAISLPCGLANNLPVGIQLMAPAMGDEELLKSAWAAEHVLGATLQPPLA